MKIADYDEKTHGAWPIGAAPEGYYRAVLVYPDGSEKWAHVSDIPGAPQLPTWTRVPSKADRDAHAAQRAAVAKPKKKP